MSFTLPTSPAPSAPAPAPTAAPAAPVAPIRVPALAWILVTVAAVWIAYALLGSSAAPSVWDTLIEFFHDGRHFLGVPCH
jgi:hypothetical protein